MEGEPPELLRRTEPRARRSYSCCECSRSINPGDRYVNYSGKWPGGWYTFRMCLWCDVHRRIAVRKLADSADEGPAFRYLHEWIEERTCIGTS